MSFQAKQKKYQGQDRYPLQESIIRLQLKKLSVRHLPQKIILTDPQSRNQQNQRTRQTNKKIQNPKTKRKSKKDGRHTAAHFLHVYYPDKQPGCTSPAMLTDALNVRSDTGF